MQAKIIKDTNFLTPNKDHKNFTDSIELARVGDKIEGEFKNISGLRKGQPFVYRLFVTKNGKILYANTVQTEIPIVEVVSNANAENLKPVELEKNIPNKNSKYAGLLLAVGGGVAGYFYAKKKNVTQESLIKFIAVGAVGVYGIYWLLNQNKSTVNKQIK
jgi:hypothetical protein